MLARSFGVSVDRLDWSRCLLALQTMAARGQPVSGWQMAGPRNRERERGQSTRLGAEHLCETMTLIGDKLRARAN